MPNLPTLAEQVVKDFTSHPTDALCLTRLKECITLALQQVRRETQRNDAELADRIARRHKREGSYPLAMDGLAKEISAAILAQAEQG